MRPDAPQQLIGRLPRLPSRSPERVQGDSLCSASNLMASQARKPGFTATVGAPRGCAPPSPRCQTGRLHNARRALKFRTWPCVVTFVGGVFILLAADESFGGPIQEV